MRKADDYVDSIPQEIENFLTFKKYFLSRLNNESAGIENEADKKIIDAFVEMLKRKEIPQDWVISFLDSMEMDIHKTHYESFEDLFTYIYGSAEVVGLFMCKILNLPKESYESAKKLGQAMQLLNMIRDIEQDKKLGRQYIPKNDIFSAIKLYKEIQKEAEKGFKYIPYKYLVPIKTASDMYLWTAKKLEQNPDIIFKTKVKPKRAYVIWTLIKNAFVLLF